MDRLLESVPFRHPERAQRNLAGLDPFLDAETRDILQPLLAQSPDPDAALHSLERYFATAGPPPESLARASCLNALVAVFAHSHFLSETLFQHTDLLGWTLERGELHRVLSADELRAQLGRLPIGKMDRPAVALALARFKRRNLLRIMLRDVLGRATLAEVTLELSNLADTLLEAALERVRAELAGLHGRPLLASGEPCEFTVLALGKLGGQELNYSSDIDLLYLFSGAGETDGPQKITNKEFSIKLANQLTDLLSSNTTEGLCYRVDLRLRPEGKLGEVAQSLHGLCDYYQRRARDWELQMLIKARAAAGSPALGQKFLQFVEPLIYKTTTDFSAIESVSETRERIHEKLRRKAPAGLNVKLSRGGIRDVEFLVQCLQRLYGGRDPWVRHGGTLVALHRLRDKGYLAARDYARLNAAYQFLRAVEHRLQLEYDRQVHTLPPDEGALETLARKVAASGPAGLGRQPARPLVEQTERHLRAVTEIYDRVIHGHGPPAQPLSDSPPLFQLEMESPQEPAELSMQAQLRYLEMRAPGLAARIAAAPLHRGRRLFEHFLGKLVSMQDLLSDLEQKPELIDLAADLFEHSPFFAEWLIRNPEEIHQLLEVAAFAPSDQQAPLFALEPARRGALGNAELAHLLHTHASVNDKSAWLRRFYRRQMLRIQSESICRRSPIFATLEQTTELADWVVQAAYQIAFDEAVRSGGLAASGPRMHVVALGRLGMREFDLGSDADLVFILPDAAKPEVVQWARVAERLIEVLASYTGEGTIFSVDTRLRPLGREGELVQTESAYRSYFAGQAQAWEAITYMKSRCLAGDLEKGTGFLHDLQSVDWRRYGQSGTLAALLLEMRRKLEKEQGPEQPLKAARGGYYDIDFVLMYLRLRGAGIFYPSLNTPERIDVIERMGLLGREDAEFLHAAAVFFRALDHGLRVSSGRSLGTLPKARSQYEILTELVRRWTPASLHGRPLEDLLAEMRRRTREMFNRIFEAS
ncbi:MAG TPA: glutamine-synthetase adenylyltransferase [Bryobacterales bacterium]|nr:glutamine-synthetase adenylyltransferase [Bryobacterales bacterium]